MNITQTFRRKNKFHKPILVFKQLYRDYYKYTSKQKFIPSLSKQSQQIYSNTHFNKQKSLSRSLSKKSFDGVPKLNKTKSAEHFTKYLQKFGQPGSTFLDLTKSKLSGLKKSRSSNNNTFVFRLMQRNQLQQTQKQKQSYFPNSYTKSHPFFQKARGTFKQKNIDQNQAKIPKILPEIFRQTSNKIKLPVQKRIQLQQLKNQFKERKVLAKQKYSKIRYNFLIKKNFKYQKQNNQQNLTSNVKNNLNFNYKQKILFQRTKQNIFPQTSL